MKEDKNNLAFALADSDDNTDFAHDWPDSLLAEMDKRSILKMLIEEIDDEEGLTEAYRCLKKAARIL